MGSIKDLPTIDDESFDRLVNSKRFVLVFAYATWAVPAKMPSPAVVEIAEERNSDNFSLYVLDVDASPGAANELAETAIPSYVIYKDGTKAKVLKGASSKADLSAFIDGVVKS